MSPDSYRDELWVVSCGFVKWFLTAKALRFLLDKCPLSGLVIQDWDTDETD